MQKVSFSVGVQLVLLRKIMKQWENKYFTKSRRFFYSLPPTFLFLFSPFPGIFSDLWRMCTLQTRENGASVAVKILSCQEEFCCSLSFPSSPPPGHV